MHVQPLFPSFIASEQLEPGVVDNDRICDYGYRLRRDHSEGIYYGGYQTPDLETDLPEAKDLLDVVLDRAQGLWSRLLNGLPHYTPEITQWWINIQEPGGDCFPPHVHKGHVVSFVYYPRVAEDCGKLGFIAPFQGMEYAFPLEYMGEKNMYTSPRWEVTPTTGLLVAFPSYLMHWVDINRSTEDRISVAFNIGLKEQNGTT